MKIKHIVITVITGGIAAILLSLFPSDSIYAADYSTMLDKWLYTQYYQCLKSDTYTASSITNMKESNFVVKDVFKTSGTMYLPSYYLAGNAKTSLNCQEIALGNNRLSSPFNTGVLGAYSGLKWSSKNSSESLMTNALKYTPDMGAPIEGVSTFRITATRKSKTTNCSIWCNSYEGEAEAQSVLITTKLDDNGTRNYSYSDGFSNFFSDIKIGFKNHSMTVDVSPPIGCHGGSLSETFPLKYSTEEFFNDLSQGLANRSVSYTCIYTSSAGPFMSTTTSDYTFTFTLTDKNIGIVDSTSVVGYAKTSSTPLDSLKAVSIYTYTTSSGNGGLRFNHTDYYNLYTYYLSKVVAGSGGTVNVATCNPANTYNLTQVTLLDESGQKNSECYINLNGSDPAMINIYTQTYTTSNGPTISQITLQDAINWLNNEADFNQINTAEVGNIVTINPSTPTPDGGDGNNVSTLTVCYASAGVLGWIACPVLEVMAGATKTMYNFIEGSLSVNISAMDNNGGLYRGWEIFRNIANILFAIAFLVVILAQITGIGISNYNVKKILPRLIVIAILVNISFIICQLAVDISNILGSQLKSLFESFASKAANGDSDLVFNLGTVMGGFIGTGVMTSLGVLVVSVLAFTIPFEIWLLPIILTVLGCVVSILFFFIIIAVRQAGVIILIALAPVAIVCYALPNTKPAFDRWKKLFTALLLVYPICGLLMGGGTFASTILMQEAVGSNDSGFLAIVSILVTIIPFFLIPGILKGSMAALGNLGMRISEFGKGFNRMAGGAIRNSEAYKNFQRQQQLKYDERAAKRFRNRLAARTEAGKEDKGFMYDHLKRGEYRHQAAANRTRFEDYRAEAGIGSIEPTSAAGKAILDNLKQEQLANDTKYMRSAYESDKGFDVNDIGKVGGEYYEQLEALHKDPTSREALTRMRALQDILMESDAGRTQIKNQQLRHAFKHRADYGENGQAATGDSALSLAAAHMLAAHQGEIKKVNRGTWSMQQDFAKRDFSNLFGENGSIAQLAPDKEEYGSSYYETKGLDGYDENTLAGADEDVLTSINRAIQSGTLTPQQQSQITALAGEAYGKDSLSVQSKVGEQLRKAIVSGNTPSTIGGISAKTLSRLATNIKQGVLTRDPEGKDRTYDNLIGMAREALEKNQVLDSARAAALNSILTAAGEEPVEWSGQISAQGQGGGTSGDSGPLHGGGSTSSGIIIPGAQESRDILSRAQDPNAARRDIEQQRHNQGRQ